MQARLILPAATLAALALCASPAAAKPVALTIDDAGRTVTVRTGDTITVALESNQTTPYHWKVRRRPRPAVARITAQRYVDGGTGVPGAPGMQRYRLRATGPGSTTFQTRYEEITSGRVGTGRSVFTITIRVRG